jgi:hypothetical protein
MAHLIEPVTRQRDDQAWLMNDSRKVMLRSVVFDGSMAIPIHWWLGCGCLVYSFRWLALAFLLL